MKLKQAQRLAYEIIDLTFMYGDLDYGFDLDDIARDTVHMMSALLEDDFDYVIHAINNVTPNDEGEGFEELMSLIHRLEDLKATYLLHRQDKHKAPVEEHF